MTLEAAINKVNKVALGEWKFSENDFQDLVRFLEELKGKRDEELKALSNRLRHDKTFTFTYHWTKGSVLAHNHKAGSEQEVYMGPTILDAVNKYVEKVLNRGYSTSVIDYCLEEVV